MLGNYMEIIATFRFSSNRNDYSDVLARMKRNGVTKLRVNFGRGGLEEKVSELNWLLHRGELDNFKLIFDLPCPGKKFRLLGKESETRNIRKGEEIRFGECNADYRLILPWERICENERFYIGDGEISFQVIQKGEKCIVAKAENSGVIRGNRAVVFEKGLWELNMKEMDEYMKLIQEFHPYGIALSFAEDKDVLREIKQKIRDQVDYHVLIYSKIESQRGVDNVREICTESDVILVGRGDLALNSNLLDFGKNQDHVIQVCKELGKEFCIATDILISLYNCPIPTRGDLIDVYYLKKEYGCQEVICSAGISCSELLDQFVYIMNHMETN